MALTHFFSKIAGVDDPNPDGTPRESLLGQCRPAQRLRLIREPGPPFDDGTVAVCLPNGVPLGYVTERATDTVSRWLDEGAHVDVFVARLTGDEPGQPVGCILLVVAANDDESEDEIVAYVREQLEVAARLREILAAPPHAPQVLRQATATERPTPWPRRWSTIGLVAAGCFLIAAATVWVTGVSGLEKLTFQAIVRMIDRDNAFFVWCARLGSERLVLIAGVFLLVLLRGHSLRRWWLWVAIVVAVATLEGMGKSIIGRPRPEAARPGFPSGHTSLAAAFYLTAAYIIARDMHRRWARRLTYGAAAVVVLAVGLSRIVLWHHWPLDVVGGAALGVVVWAVAVCWYERYPFAARPEHWQTAAVRAWVHRHQLVIPIPCFALVLLTPPLGLLDSRLDLAFDIGGSAGVAVGLWLRLWTAGHAHADAGQDRFALPSTGPYTYMRHPRPLAHLLIGFGCVVFTESGPGLFLITAVLVAVYRVAVAVEEEALATRFGAAYAEHCARVPNLPRPSVQLLRAAVSMRWQAVRLELRFVAVTLLLAGLADASEFIPRLFE